MPALAGLRESGGARRVPGISADKPSKEALHRRPIGETQAKARSVARFHRSFCGNGGLASANRGKHAARQRPYRSPPAAAPVQKAPKTALGRAAAPTQVHGAQCGTEGAAGKEAVMYANPKETTSLRLDETIKRRNRELLALHGITLTEAFEEYMDELIYQGGRP